MFKKVLRVYVVITLVLFTFIAPSVSAKPNVTWLPNKVNEEIVAGNSKILLVSFTAQDDFNSATIRVVPELQSLVSVIPTTVGPVAKGSVVNISINISAPYDSPPADIQGTLQVRISKGTLAKPLPINIRVLGRFGAPSGFLIGPEGGIVESGGTSLTIPEGTLTADVQLGVGPIVQDNLPLSLTSDLSFVGGGFVEASDNIFNIPAELGIPAPLASGVGDQFLVATPINVQGEYRLWLVDIAEIIGGSLITQQVFGLPFSFPGITSSGIFAFLKPFEPVGFVGGTVKRGNVPVSGAVITINSLPLFVCVTDEQGRYIIPGVVGSFTINAFDPDTGAFSSENGNIPFLGGGVSLDISLASPTIKSGLLVNGSFEQTSCTSLDNWELVGSVSAVASLGSDPQGRPVINPTHKSCMAMISTGGLSVGGASSSIRQSFTIPSGITTLLFDYNFITEEYPEFVGSVFNDAFHAVLRKSNGEEIQIAYGDVNTSVFVPVGGIDFPGGDSTTGMTGWRIAAFDVTSIAGTDELLTLSITDAGDTIYDSVTLIDNVRLSTGSLAFPFTFPIKGQDAYSAKITSVFDHSSNPTFYPSDNKVVAFTGEAGEFDQTLKQPEQRFRAWVWGTHYGFRNPEGTVFSVRGQYTGGWSATATISFEDPGPDALFGTSDDTVRDLLGRSFIYYDGHPGYDYSTGEGANVYPVAPGTITSWACDRVEITHQDGYKSVYMHMKDSKRSGTVTTETVIGTTSGMNSQCVNKWDPHLHFEVHRSGVSIDPYGWEGFSGDPYFQGKSERTSVNVWRNTQR